MRHVRLAIREGVHLFASVRGGEIAAIQMPSGDTGPPRTRKGRAMTVTGWRGRAGAKGFVTRPVWMALALAVLPLLLASGYLAAQQAKANARAVQTRALHEAEAAARRLDREILVSVEVLTALERSGSFLAERQDRDRMRTLDEISRSRDGWRSVFLLDAAGRRTLDTADPGGGGRGTACYPDTATLPREGNWAASGFSAEGSRDGGACVLVVVPMRGGQRAPGFACARLDPASLQQALVGARLDGFALTVRDGRRNVVVRRAAEAVYAADKDDAVRFAAWSWEPQRGPAATPGPDYGGVGRLRYVAWTVEAEPLPDVVDSEVVRPLRVSVALIAGALFLGVALAWPALRRAVPVVALAEAPGSPRSAGPGIQQAREAPGVPEGPEQAPPHSPAMAPDAQSRLEEERAARLAAEAADRAKDGFLRMLGHELRNPLGALTTAIAVLQRVDRASAAAADALAIVSRQTAQLTRLVDELLDASRIVSGKIALQLEAVDLAQAVGKSTSVAAAQAGGRHRITLQTEQAWVRADPLRLEQILGHLLAYATKHAPPSSTIGLSVRSERNAMVLELSDEGPGIPPDLMEPPGTPDAEQLHGGGGRRPGGLGLGLTLLKRLVELHGGTVGAASSSKGATLTLRFPPMDGQEIPARIPPSKRVLIIEDNADVREALRTMLHLEGHQVSIASDGRAGLDKLLGEVPDAAIVDLGLPEMDGLDLARQARAAGYSGLLIALSGYGLKDSAQSLKETGFDAHLTKPAPMGVLMELIGRASAAAGSRQVP